MTNTIAMAGMAEAAVSFGLLIVGALLFAVIVSLIFAWFRRSMRVATIACIVLAVATFLLQPWSVFTPPSSTNDPDEAYWIERYRFVSAIWACIFVATIACLIRASRSPRLQPNEQQAVI